jgi:hypothetical protein
MVFAIQLIGSFLDLGFRFVNIPNYRTFNTRAFTAVNEIQHVFTNKTTGHPQRGHARFKWHRGRPGSPATILRCCGSDFYYAKKTENTSSAIAEGARGYLMKMESGNESLQAIATARDGKTFLSAKQAAQLPTDTITICSRDDWHRSDLLTCRERKEPNLISKGRTNRARLQSCCSSVSGPLTGISPTWRTN